MKEVHYALVAHADFQKNSCARINNKKRNHALSIVHFKHITNNSVSPAKYDNILGIKFTNILVLRILILWATEHYDQCTLNCSERFGLNAKLAAMLCLQLLWNTINQVPDTTESKQKVQNKLLPEQSCAYGLHSISYFWLRAELIKSRLHASC